jgi:hypothetical protein
MSFKDWLAKRKAKKGAKAAQAGKPAAAGGKLAASVKLGDSNLAKAIKRGAEVIDAKVAGGKMNDAQAKANFNRLMDYKPKIGTPDEDAAVIEVAQIIGFLSKA